MTTDAVKGGSAGKGYKVDPNFLYKNPDAVVNVQADLTKEFDATLPQITVKLSGKDVTVKKPATADFPERVYTIKGITQEQIDWMAKYQPQTYIIPQ